MLWPTDVSLHDGKALGSCDGYSFQLTWFHKMHDITAFLGEQVL